MSKPVVISARIDAETAAALDSMAVSRQRSRAWLVAEAVRRMAEEEAAYLAFIQEGLDDIAAGRTIPHADVMVWVAEKRAEIEALKAGRAA